MVETKEGGRDGSPGWVDQMNAVDIPFPSVLLCFSALEHSLKRTYYENVSSAAGRVGGIKAVLHCLCKMTTAPHLKIT